MGKHSQAKQAWLTGSQRASRGQAESGARLWGTTDGRPITRKGIEDYRAQRAREAQAQRDRQTAAPTEPNDQGAER